MDEPKCSNSSRSMKMNSNNMKRIEPGESVSDESKPKLKFSKLSSTSAIRPGNSPNGQIVAAHYNEIKEKNLSKRKASKIIHMRNLNNWIKSELINEYCSIIKRRKKFGEPFWALDLCCGKGGDLYKWRNNITHLIATDIAEVSIEDCKERYDSIRRETAAHSLYSAEFFACDATKEVILSYFRDPSSKVQITSCQFAFHYCFESFEQANVMIRNASSCLEEGGFFICTIPDANEIMRRLYNSDNLRTFGNEFYNITFQCDINPPPLFGAKYVFKLEDRVDCPEFLVHFPTMVQLCRRHGLVLVRNNTFVEYFEEKKESGEMLLHRMHCFKEIDTNSITADNAEYKHVLKYKRCFGSDKVSTLSKSEWEAFCLYKICVFKKCKYILGDDGYPKYIFDDYNDYREENKPSTSKGFSCPG